MKLVRAVAVILVVPLGVLGALGAAVGELAVRKAEHAQLRQNQLALAEQHPAGQHQHKQLKRRRVWRRTAVKLLSGHRPRP